MKLRRSGVRERGFGELGYPHRMRLLHGWPADAFESQELELLAWAEHRSALLEQSHAGLPWAFWWHEHTRETPRGGDFRACIEPRPCGAGDATVQSDADVQRKALEAAGLRWPAGVRLDAAQSD